MGVLLYGLIWLFGVIAFMFYSRFSFTPFYHRIFLAVSGALLLVLLILSRINSPDVFSDFTIGGAFAAMLVPLAQTQRINAVAAKVSEWSSRFSYTLYLAHFPIVAFLACYVLRNQRMLPSLTSAAIFLGFLATIIAYAFVVYLLFERNTGVVRKAILQVLAPYRSGANPKPVRGASGGESGLE
jgi:peptidoglycan/LPS O-acetylase OafA/YrhL